MAESLSLAELQEKRRKLAHDIKELGTTADKWSDEDRAKWEAMNTDYDVNLKTLDEARDAQGIQDRLDQIKSDDERSVHGDARKKVYGFQPVPQEFSRNLGRPEYEGEITEEIRSLAFHSWMQAQAGCYLDDKHTEACHVLQFNPHRRHLDIPLLPGVVTDGQLWVSRGHISNELRSKNGWQTEYRVQDTTTDAELIPEGFVFELEKKLQSFGGPRRVCRIMRTPTGNDMPWPRNDDVTAGRLLTESTAVTVTDIATSSVTFNAFKYSSDQVTASSEILEDSAFDMATQVIAPTLGERLGRITSTHFTTGTGTAQPNGIVTAATVGVTAASMTVIAADELFDLQHSLDPAYWDFPSTGWMFHDNVMLAVRKLQDSQNQYLWQEGLSAGAPDMLLGKPFTVNQDMSSTITTGDKVIVYGAFEKYIIRDVANIRFYRMTERFRDTDEEGFVSFSRHDGDTIQATALQVLQML